MENRGIDNNDQILDVLEAVIKWLFIFFWLFAEIMNPANLIFLTDLKSWKQISFSFSLNKMVLSIWIFASSLVPARLEIFSISKIYFSHGHWSSWRLKWNRWTSSFILSSSFKSLKLRFRSWKFPWRHGRSFFFSFRRVSSKLSLLLF